MQENKYHKVCKRKKNKVIEAKALKQYPETRVKIKINIQYKQDPINT